MGDVYRPSGDGGEFQIKSGSKWIPIRGIASIDVSGGDRESSTFENLDTGIASSFGAAGVKDISLTLNPSFMSAQYRKIVNDSYYGNDPVTVRYRTLANVSDIAKGAASHGITIKQISAGIGNESELTFEGSTGVSKTAADAIQETDDLGIVTSGSNTAVDGERTEAEPAAGKFLIVRYDGAKYMVSSWDGKAVSALSAVDGWNLIRYGLAVEYTCRVITAMNPSFGANAAISETLTFRQISSGFKAYPITKAAT